MVAEVSKLKSLINLIYSLGLIVFVYVNWSFIFGGKILYGTSFSFQSYPLTVEYFRPFLKAYTHFLVGIMEWDSTIWRTLSSRFFIRLRCFFRLYCNHLIASTRYSFLFHVALIFITSIKLSNYFLLNTKYSCEKAIIGTYLAVVIILNISIFFELRACFFLLPSLLTSSFDTSNRKIFV